ncbi:MAG: DUF456 domain-containing protein [Flavobacteriaceae bacterium]
MEYLILLLSFLLVIGGIVGCFLPLLPGPVTGWLGILLLYQHPSIPSDPLFLGWSFVVALIIFLLDYWIPIAGAKTFGGTQAGIRGATVGLVLGLIFMGLLGLVLGPFLGAVSGELIDDPKDRRKALRAGLGSFLGFLGGTLLKVLLAVYFLVVFVQLWVTYTM